MRLAVVPVAVGAVVVAVPPAGPAVAPAAPASRVSARWRARLGSGLVAPVQLVRAPAQQLPAAEDEEADDRDTQVEEQAGQEDRRRAALEIRALDDLVRSFRDSLGGSVSQTEVAVAQVSLLQPFSGLLVQQGGELLAEHFADAATEFLRFVGGVGTLGHDAVDDAGPQQVEGAHALVLGQFGGPLGGAVHDRARSLGGSGDSHPC